MAAIDRVQVERGLEGLGAEFRAMFDRVAGADRGLRHLAPLPLSLSTITFTGKLNVDRVDLTDVAVGMGIGAADEDPFFLADDYSEPAADTADAPPPAKRPRRQKKKFHNQLPLVARSGKAVKLFHNGSIHVTGCSSPIEFLHVVVTLCAFLPTVCNVSPLCLEAFDVQMINANFLLRTPAGHHVVLRPQCLRREISRARQEPADFETERHPGVKVVVRDAAAAKIATVMVFQTGSVQISGAKSPAHVAEAYAEACALVDGAVGALGEAVCRPDPASTRTTTAKQPFALSRGYPATLLRACMLG